MLDVVTRLCCAVFAMAWLATVVTSALFCYETFNGPHLDRLKIASGGRVWLWVLRGAVSGFLSLIITILAWPLGFVRRIRRPSPAFSAMTPPIILINGLYHNPAAWLLFRLRLKRAGFHNVILFRYDSVNGAMTDILDALDREVVEARSAAGGADVVLIGHSLGGIIARNYVQEPERVRGVALVATLGTPFLGSKVAALGPGRLARELADRARSGDTGSRSPAGVRGMVLLSPVDAMVLPHDSLLAAPSDWIVETTPPVSHISLLYHGGTARRVIRFMENVTGSV